MLALCRQGARTLEYTRRLNGKEKAHNSLAADKVDNANTKQIYVPTVWLQDKAERYRDKQHSYCMASRDTAERYRDKQHSHCMASR